MKARVARSIERLDNIATELSLTVSGTHETRIGLHLGDPPPMFKQYVVEFRRSVNRVLNLAQEESMLSPHEAKEGKETDKLRDRLRKGYMIPLRRTGKPLLRFAPGVEKALKVPHAHAAHRKIVTSAEVMLKAVQPYRKLLSSANFSKTFFTEFRDLAKELKRIATGNSQRKRKFDRVTDSISEELATANETLGKIEGLILAATLRKPRLGKEWRELMKYPTRRGRPPATKQKLPPRAMLARSGSEMTV